jgi:DNA-binding beta-propeller fold protein YncE
MFHYSDNKGIRVPKQMTSYGFAHSQSLEVDTFMIPYIDSNTMATNFEKSLPRYHSVGEFDQPVDIAVGSFGGYYSPDSDFVYIVDQANRRIVKLRYDQKLDSLAWEGTFGEDILQFPTAIAYADYGSPNRMDHDVYVTDAGQAKFIRFSASGIYESDYGGFGSMISRIGYPTGIAAYPSPNHGTLIYVSDSYNHCVVGYKSETVGEIVAFRQFRIPLSPLPFIAAVDVDSWGNVYVVDSYNHKITILNSETKVVIAEFGSRGTGTKQFESPRDICINKKGNQNEIVVCEWWDQLSGIRCLKANSNPNPMKSNK